MERLPRCRRTASMSSRSPRRLSVASACRRLEPVMRAFYRRAPVVAKLFAALSRAVGAATGGGARSNAIEPSAATRPIRAPKVVRLPCLSRTPPDPIVGRAAATDRPLAGQADRASGSGRPVWVAICWGEGCAWCPPLPPSPIADPTRTVAQWPNTGCGNPHT
jgi:hypothetical protein